MIQVRSYAKINLWLEVLGRRPDGYHEVKTILQTIDIFDDLLFQPSADFQLQIKPPVVSAGEDNLIWKAAEALAKRVGERPAVGITVYKKILVGGGLGGGSSNAAVTLLALDKLWQLGLDFRELYELARPLGADVPFFLMGGTVLGTGRGDELYPLPDPDSRLELLILYPGFQIATAEAYRLLDESGFEPAKPSALQALCSGLAQGRLSPSDVSFCFNSFEAPLFAKYPVLAEAKRALVAAGAEAALLCGSGSSLFGVFGNSQAARRAWAELRRERWTVRRARSLMRRHYRRAWLRTR